MAGGYLNYPGEIDLLSRFNSLTAPLHFKLRNATDTYTNLGTITINFAIGSTYLPAYTGILKRTTKATL